MVGEPAGAELAGAPDRRVDRRDNTDLRRARAVRREVERRETPGQSVVQVVDEPRLRAGAQDRVASVTRGECLTERDLCSTAPVRCAARAVDVHPCRGRTATEMTSPATAIDRAPTQTTCGREGRGQRPVTKAGIATPR